MHQFETKDSGKREEYTSGMRRDVQEGKPRIDLVPLMVRATFDSLIRCMQFKQQSTDGIGALNDEINYTVTNDVIGNIEYLINSLIVYEVIKIQPINQVQGVAELYLRLAGLYGRGAVKYGENNWQKACGEAEYIRFKQSTLRHWYQYLAGHTDEDHFCAVLFNLYGMYYTAERRTNEEKGQT